MNLKATNIVGIDLGNSSFKAVRLQKKGAQYVFVGAALLPTGSTSPTPVVPTEQSLAAQIKELASKVKAAGADVHFVTNSLNSTVRYVELPSIPLDEVRSAIKLNSATYLRQSFENYIFDVFALDPTVKDAFSVKKQKKEKGAPAPPSGKIKSMIGGVSSPEITLYFHAARRAGIKPQSLQLSPIALMNAFEAAYPDIFKQQAVAILELGFLSSTLTILDRGQPLLTRTVPIGGKQISEYIAQISNVDFVKAEAMKSEENFDLSEAVSRICVNLTRETLSSISFFEKNSDQLISKVYLTGASVGSPSVVKALSEGIGSACEVWNPANGLTMELPAAQREVFAKNPYMFAAALGVARAYIPSIAPQQKAAPKAKEKTSTSPTAS